jgi:hypothetical protein
MPCGADDLTCPGGQDWNGCQMPDTCQWMPKGIKYNCHTWYLKVIITLLYLHTDGTCVPQCPATCAPVEMMCPKGLDSNQCPMADYCMPKTSKQLFPYKIHPIEKYNLMLQTVRDLMEMIVGLPAQCLVVLMIRCALVVKTGMAAKCLIYAYQCLKVTTSPNLAQAS